MDIIPMVGTSDDLQNHEFVSDVATTVACTDHNIAMLSICDPQNAL